MQVSNKSYTSFFVLRRVVANYRRTKIFKLKSNTGNAVMNFSLPIRYDMSHLRWWWTLVAVACANLNILEVIIDESCIRISRMKTYERSQLCVCTTTGLLMGRILIAPTEGSITVALMNIRRHCVIICTPNNKSRFHRSAYSPY